MQNYYIRYETKSITILCSFKRLIGIQDSTITVSLLVSVFCIQIFDCKDIFHRVEVVSTEICQEEGEEDKDESLAGR